MAEQPVPIGDSRGIPGGAMNIRPSDPTDLVHVSVLLRPRSAPVPAPAATTPISPEEFSRLYGAKAEDIETVRQFATAHGLTVGEVDSARRMVVLSGPVSLMNPAFGVHLNSFEIEGKTFRSHAEQPSVPGALRAVVTGVVGLDDLPAARPH